MQLITMVRSAMAAALLSVPVLGVNPGERITLRQGFPFVDITINGRGPFHMLLDTGASASLLTPKAAQAAGLEFDHRVILTTLAGEKIVPGASDNTVEIAGTEETGLTILALDLPEVRALDHNADGVLGQSFLSRNPYLLDYDRKRLWIGSSATELALQLPNSVTATQSRGRVVLPVSLDPDGRVWQLTLDSGSTNLIVDCSDRCPRAWGVERDSRVVTHAGERSVRRGTLRMVALGGSTMPAANAVLLDGVAAEGWGDGLLPTRWFSAFYVSENTVRFAPAR